ncbi:MAG: hypothetical protein ACXVEF_02435 [Polyangiales bacterium]
MSRIASCRVLLLDPTKEALMYTMFRNGGFPMFFILAFGLIALGTAFGYAIKPVRDRESFVRWMALATLASVFCGTAADLAAVASYVASHAMEPARMCAIVIEGIGESMSPSILGFSILSLVALMMAVGKRRLDAFDASLRSPIEAPTLAPRRA